MRAPLDSPVMADFVARLQEINQLAEASPGFVWRLQTDAGDATEIRVDDDPCLLINLSVWESVDALGQYVYRSRHVELLRDRRKWFEPQRQPQLALWWIPAGQVPSAEEGMRRLHTLREVGPSPEAFPFRKLYPQPGGRTAARVPDSEQCLEGAQRS